MADEDFTDHISAMDAGLGFHPSGDVSLWVPRMEQLAHVPIHVMAATEIMLRISNGELTLAELAEAFERRPKS